MFIVGNRLTSNGTSWASSAAAAGGAMTLLKANSGQKTSNWNSATNLDTVAISGLTALDTLFVTFALREVNVQPTGVVVLHDGTNNIGDTSNGVTNDNTRVRSYLMQKPNVATTVLWDSWDYAAGGYTSASGTIASWTGSWTLALRCAGTGSATASAHWTWAVYKIAGQ